MLSQETQEKILELAATDMTIKKISSLVKHSKIAVSSVIRRGAVRCKKHAPPNPDRFRPPNGNYQLCPHCHCMVQSPCLACWLKSHRRKV